MIMLLLETLGFFALAHVLRERATLSKGKLAAGLVLGVTLIALVLGLTLSQPYIIGKVIGRLLMPAGMLWFALYIGVFVSYYARKQAMGALFLFAWLGLTFTGNEYVGGKLLDTLEAPYRSVQVFEEKPFDAVWVLGGGTFMSGDYAQLGESGDRVMLGARLHKAGIAPVLVTSGSSIAGLGAAQDAAATTTTIWTSLGISEDNIIQVPGPKNTREELIAFKKLADEKGWKRVGLLTSAWHMRRAMKLAGAQGLEVQPLPADFRGGRRDKGKVLPEPSGFVFVHRACWEYLGALAGR